MRPYTLVKKLSKEVANWRRVWLTSELITLPELYRRLSLLESIPSERRAAYRAKYNQLKDSRYVFKAEKTWKSDPVWIKNVLFAEGFFGHTWVPLKEYKYFPIRNWANIRSSWDRRKKAVNQQLQKLLVELGDVQRQLDDTYRQQLFDPNACQFDCDVDDRVYAKPDSGQSLTLHGSSNVENNYSDSATIPWLHTSLITTSLQWFSGSKADGSEEPIYQFELLTNVTERAIRTAIDHPGSGVRVYPGSLVRSGYHYIMLPRAMANSLTFYQRAADGVIEVIHEPLPEIRPLMASPAGPIVYDSTPHKVRSDSAFLERIILLNSALRNLNLKRDAKEFNLARSLAELKDMPQSVKDGRDFLRALREPNVINGAFTVRYRRSATPILVHKRCFSPAQARVIKLLQDNPNCRARKKLLASVGLRSVKATPIGKGVTLAKLASLYLSYKFAVAPTVGDIHTVMNNSREYVMAIRRGLKLLESKYGSEYAAQIPVRKQFRMIDPAFHGSNTKVRKNTQIVSDTDSSFTYNYDETFRIEISPSDLYEVQPYQRARAELPILGANDGLWILHPHAIYNPGALDNKVRERVSQVLDKHNIDVLLTRVPEIYRSLIVNCREACFGNLFCHVKAEDVAKALDGTNWRNWLAGIQPYQTAWDLLPLSFVVEWFTNLGAVAEAANNVWNRHLTGVRAFPIWGSFTSMLFASRVSCPYATLECEVDASSHYHAAVYHSTLQQHRGSGALAWPTYYDLRVHGTLGHDADIARVLRRTSIRRYTRQPIVGLPEVPWPRFDFHVTLPQAGSLAAMVLSGG